MVTGVRVGKERGCWVSRLTDGRMCWRRPRLSREQEAPQPRWPGYLVFLRRSSAWVAVCTAERGTAAIRHAVLSSTLAAGYLPPTARPQTSLRHAQGALKGSPLSVRSAHREGKQDPRGGRGLRPGRGGRGLPWCTSRPADPGFVGPRPSAGPGARDSRSTGNAAPCLLVQRGPPGGGTCTSLGGPGSDWSERSVASDWPGPVSSQGAVRCPFFSAVVNPPRT